MSDAFTLFEKATEISSGLFYTPVYTPATAAHEQVIYFKDEKTGLQAIIAIHDTTFGPSLGGARMWPYPNLNAALDDVLRLSKGMTYKAAISGLNHGGGKAVII